MLDPGEVADLVKRFAKQTASNDLGIIGESRLPQSRKADHCARASELSLAEDEFSLGGEQVHGGDAEQPFTRQGTVLHRSVEDRFDEPMRKPLLALVISTIMGYRDIGVLDGDNTEDRRELGAEPVHEIQIRALKIERVQVEQSRVRRPPILG